MGPEQAGLESPTAFSPFISGTDLVQSARICEGPVDARDQFCISTEFRRLFKLVMDGRCGRYRE
jgi:hypothetical protein